MKKTKYKEKIAAFIDAANIELSAKDRGWRVDYRKLYDWLKQQGSLVCVCFFTVRFNTPQHDAFLTVLKKTGFQLITKPLKRIRDRKSATHVRKANFDVEIAVEALKRADSFTSLFLFSGDSDFDYLLKELRKKCKRLVVLSTRYHISKELIKRTDLYIDIRRIRKFIERK